MPNLINTPDAARLINALRDTGYTFNSAVANLVDNSIAAGANAIRMDIHIMEDGKKVVCLGDDGCGMDRNAVHKAMCYGSPGGKDVKRLGKFGLGLKTASSSICRRFSLLSRKSVDQPVAKVTWDLDHVVQQNAWELLEEPVTEEQKLKFEKLCGESGTLVIWEKCDRLLSRNCLSGTGEKAAIRRVTESLDKHLSLMFHRFLDPGDMRERKVGLQINGNEVQPWNPFYPARSEQVLPESQQELLVKLPDGSEGKIGVKAWILPHRKSMTRDEENQFARISNKSQGFYIYREGRLLSDGGWMGIFGSREPKTSLLRIELDYGHELDRALLIDLKRSVMLVHPDLAESLREILKPAYKLAGTRYQGK